jgi:hypothetical protein
VDSIVLRAGPSPTAALLHLLVVCAPDICCVLQMCGGTRVSTTSSSACCWLVMMPVRCERLRRDAHPRDATVEVEADPGFLMTYRSKHGA